MIDINSARDKEGKILSLIFYTALFTLLFLRRDLLFKSIEQSLNYSLYVLVPSLFPFMVAASTFSLSKGAALLSDALSFFMRKVFKLPEALAPALVSAFLFGYPLGAKISAELLKGGKITEREALRFTYCSLSPGIAFTVLFVGRLSGDLRLGLFAFISTIISNLFLLFLTGINKTVPLKQRQVHKALGITNSLKIALQSSAKAMLNMSLYVIMMRALIELVKEISLTDYFNSAMSFIPHTLKAFLSAFFLEVTYGVECAFKIAMDPKFIAAGLSFGGLCVFLQLGSFFKEGGLKLWRLIFVRSVAAVITYFLMGIFYKAPLKLISVSASMYGGASEKEGGIVSALLITLLFLFCAISAGKQNNENCGN